MPMRRRDGQKKTHIPWHVFFFLPSPLGLLRHPFPACTSVRVVSTVYDRMKRTASEEADAGAPAAKKPKIDVAPPAPTPVNSHVFLLPEIWKHVIVDKFLAPDDATRGDEFALARTCKTFWQMRDRSRPAPPSDCPFVEQGASWGMYQQRVMARGSIQVKRVLRDPCQRPTPSVGQIVVHPDTWVERPGDMLRACWIGFITKVLRRTAHVYITHSFSPYYGVTRDLADVRSEELMFLAEGPYYTRLAREVIEIRDRVWATKTKKGKKKTTNATS